MLHLDLDAFFASVEQRDKPSLRGKPVVVGGVGQRGVVATASYEARVFGIRSAMPAHEARRRCPHAAFLAGRFGAYREASGQVMAILRTLSPLVEPLSLDEAFVDLRAATRPVDFTTAALESLVDELKAAVAQATGGLPASVGVGSSKFMAKVATELGKPDGRYIVEPGTEVALLGPMRVGVIPGVGPVTQDKLHRIGVETVADLQRVSPDELAQVVGRTHAYGLVELSYARDDRPVEPEREAKSISVENTFETDVVDVAELSAVAARDARQVAGRLRAARLFARTVTIKVRRHDFSTLTRSRTLLSATDRAEVIGSVATALLAAVDVTAGIRLLGVGVAGLTDLLQEDLFSAADPPADAADAADPAGGSVGDADPEGDDPGIQDTTTQDAGDQGATTSATVADLEERAQPRWLPGADVTHERLGAGWVWGAGLGRVTVRFETASTGPGPVRTFTLGDPELTLTR
ncbi:MAG: dinB [Friedmanniella sp.]|nr:dinB [Friedmanniella sp.]